MKKILIITLVVFVSGVLTACMQQLPKQASITTIEHNTSPCIKDIGTAD